MIRCPRCRAKTSVAETRASASSARRRRVCTSPGCGEKVMTIEIIVPEGVGSFLGKGSAIVPASMLKKLRKIVDDLKGVEL